MKNEQEPLGLNEFGTRDGAEKAAERSRSRTPLDLAPVEPWPAPVDGKLLLDELRAAVRRFLVLPKWASEVLPLWNVHTYAFELRSVSTYLGIESPVRRCGKTTLMSVLSYLVNRPEVAANISSPAFFRVIDETHPTLLIDEADTLLIRNDELRGILNAGYSRRMAYVVRVTNESVDSADNERKSTFQGPKSKVKNSMLARFSCWGPKAISMIGHLPETLADRCIIIRMQRKTANEACERFNEEEGLALTPLRRKCARFVLDHASAIASARPAIPQGLNDRAADICEPLLALADLAGGEWPELARAAIVGLTARAQEHNPIGSLLLDIWVLLSNTGINRMFTRDLLPILNGLSDRSWGEMTRGREMTDIWLARQLRPFGIAPRTIWIGEGQAKGYRAEDFDEARRRYVPRSEVEALLEQSRAAEATAPNPEVSHEKSERRSAPGHAQDGGDFTTREGGSEGEAAA